MSVLHNNPFLLASAAAGSPTDPTFPVQRSVRIRSSATAYFNRTPASASNRQKWTWSGWVKRGSSGNTMPFFAAGTNSSNWGYVGFSGSEQLRVVDVQGGSTVLDSVTTAVYRDFSAWYHVVFSVDTTQATAANRIQVFVNGTQYTMSALPAQNTNLYINSAVPHYSGTIPTVTGYFDGYLTEINFIDGQALTPTSFGGYNAGTGVWEPRAYTGTYGTNGFYLKFTDNSAATAAAIGKDFSGNGNNWTPNNISVTAGVTYDSMLDVPTNTSTTNANYATLNPLGSYGLGTISTLSNGNLTATSSGNSWWISTIGIPSTGKFYCEYTPASVTNVPWIGVYATNSAFGIYRSDGAIIINGSTVATVATYAANDVIAVAYDSGTGAIAFYKNNTSVYTGTITYASPMFFAGFVSTGNTVNVNFGQRPFSYTPPTGFVALNTFNLPEPTIPSGDDYHKVYTYTGNGGGLQVGEIQKPASLFNLDRSLRFRGSASAYLSKTPASASNRKTWTWSGWVKRGTLGVLQTLFSAYNSNTDSGYTEIRFLAGDTLTLSGFATNWRITTQVFRDPSAWYHIVVALDTSNATAANRIKIYVNGSEITAFSTSSNPALNDDFAINLNAAHSLGRLQATASQYFDGYLADVYLIDGQALAPTDFGTYDGNYYWTPKAYTGTYGTNGFHLEFEDNSAATAAAIGKDTSGQVNNWTPTNISVTAGNTYDSMTDVPTLTSTNVANFATFNPLDLYAGSVPANGNMSVTSTTSGGYGTISVSSGKWYWETLSTTALTNLGVAGVRSTGGVDYYATYRSDGQKNIDGTVTAYGASYTTNDIIGVALDLDGGTITFYKNGTSQGAISYSRSGSLFRSFNGVVSGGTTESWWINFGQRPFSYTPPTGFKSLNSFNVAEVTGDLETPDFVWIKSRSAATGHALFNSVTGVGKYLSSNATTAETTDVNSLIQFNKNGFLLGNAAIVNTSAATYVASAWKKGATQGFDVVNYTFTSTGTATINHSAGSVPKMILAKRRDSTEQWLVYHASGTTQSQYLGLNTNAAVATSANLWGSTAFSSTQFYFTATNGYQYTFYVFADIEGFSKFGSYVGNLSADGPFVYTGMRPRWLLIKCTTGTLSWFLFDTERSTFNTLSQRVYPNVANAEDSGIVFVDILSNGFKIRNNDTNINSSGATYIYAAFAENPFKYSLAR